MNMNAVACVVCKSPNDEHTMLLCGDGISKGCDRGFHTYCLQPPLPREPLPEGDWYCPECSVKSWPADAHSKRTFCAVHRHEATISDTTVRGAQNRSRASMRDRNKVTYWTENIDPYFLPEDELEAHVCVLQDLSQQLKAVSSEAEQSAIPCLGQHYENQWEAEDTGEDANWVEKREGNANRVIVEIVVEVTSEGGGGPKDGLCSSTEANGTFSLRLRRGSLQSLKRKARKNVGIRSRKKEKDVGRGRFIPGWGEDRNRWGDKFGAEKSDVVDEQSLAQLCWGGEDEERESKEWQERLQSVTAIDDEGEASTFVKQQLDMVLRKRIFAFRMQYRREQRRKMKPDRLRAMLSTMKNRRGVQVRRVWLATNGNEEGWEDRQWQQFDGTLQAAAFIGVPATKVSAALTSSAKNEGIEKALIKRIRREGQYTEVGGWQLRHEPDGNEAKWTEGYQLDWSAMPNQSRASAPSEPIKGKCLVHGKHRQTKKLPEERGGREIPQQVPSAEAESGGNALAGGKMSANMSEGEITQQLDASETTNDEEQGWIFTSMFNLTELWDEDTMVGIGENSGFQPRYYNAAFEQEDEKEIDIEHQEKDDIGTVKSAVTSTSVHKTNQEVSAADEDDEIAAEHWLLQRMLASQVSTSIHRCDELRAKAMSHIDKYNSSNRDRAGNEEELYQQEQLDAEAKYIDLFGQCPYCSLLDCHHQRMLRQASRFESAGELEKSRQITLQLQKQLLQEQHVEQHPQRYLQNIDRQNQQAAIVSHIRIDGNRQIKTNHKVNGSRQAVAQMFSVKMDRTKGDGRRFQHQKNKEKMVWQMQQLVKQKQKEMQIIQAKHQQKNDKNYQQGYFMPRLEEVDEDLAVVEALADYLVLRIEHEQRVEQAELEKAQRKKLQKAKKVHEKQRKAAELKQSREDLKKNRVAAKIAAKAAKDRDRELKRAVADSKRRMRPPVSISFARTRLNEFKVLSQSMHRRKKRKLNKPPSLAPLDSKLGAFAHTHPLVSGRLSSGALQKSSENTSLPTWQGRKLIVRVNGAVVEPFFGYDAKRCGGGQGAGSWI